MAEPQVSAAQAPGAARDAWALAGLALAVRLGVALGAVALHKDGTIYARAAAAAAHGDGTGLLLPLYPPLTSLLAAPLLALGLPVEPWAAMAVACASAPVAALVYLLAREGWSRPVALFAGAFAVAAPALARDGGTLLSVGPHLTLVLAALWFGARALHPGATLGWWWGAGVAAGLAYLARPEGLGAFIVLAAVAAWYVWRPAPGHRRGRTAGGAGLAFVGLATAALPYIVHASTVWGDFALSRKKRVVAVIGPERIALDTQGDGPGLGGLAAKVPGDFWEAVRDLASAWHLLLAALGVVGLIALWRVAATDRQRAARRLCALAAGAWFSLGFLLKFSLGYLSEHHLLPAAAVLLPWSAAGAWWCTRRLAAWRRWDPMPRWLPATVAAVVLAVLAAKTAVPVLGRRANDARMGAAVHAALPDGRLLVSNLPRVSWYAGMRARFIPKEAGPDVVLAYARGLGAAAIVLDAEDVERGQGGEAPTHPGLLARLERECDLAVRSAAGGADDYRAYRLRPR